MHNDEATTTARYLGALAYWQAAHWRPKRAIAEFQRMINRILSTAFERLLYASRVLSAFSHRSRSPPCRSKSQPTLRAGARSRIPGSDKRRYTHLRARSATGGSGERSDRCLAEARDRESSPGARCVRAPPSRWAFPGDFRNHASPSPDSLSSFHNVHFEGGLNHFTRN